MDSIAASAKLSTLPSTVPGSNARRATLAAFLGSTLEYYDLFVYGSAAALIFPRLFFASGDAVAGIAASFATFAAAYLLRPISAVVWGHLGDRLGRKRILVLTLIMMGVSTLAIGLLPTHDQIGAAAPVLLVLLRLIQGFSAGGESAGSSTLTIEHAPDARRGFLASFTMAGCMTGSLLASLVFIPVTALPQDQLMAWGWRVPFLLSAILVLLASVVRRSVDETPVFEAEVKEGKTAPVPLLVLFRHQWASVLRVFLGTFFAMIQILFLVFGLYFATSKSVGVPSSTMLTIQGVATAVCALMTPVWARLSDRIGRRIVWLGTTLTCAVLIFVYFWVISTGSVFWIAVVGILMFGIAYAGPNGVWPAFMSEQFAAPVRFSGLAVGVQAGLLVAGFAPSVSIGLAGTALDWVPVGLFGAACAVIAGFAMFTARETYRTRTVDLGVG